MPRQQRAGGVRVAAGVAAAHQGALLLHPRLRLVRVAVELEKTQVLSQGSDWLRLIGALGTNTRGFNWFLIFKVII